MTMYTRKMAKPTLKLGLIQMRVVLEKSINLKRAATLIEEAKNLNCSIICLPAVFNTPCINKYYREYAESVPDGETCTILSKAAEANKVHLVGGSIPEKSDGKLYNTCTVWGPSGELLVKFRKIHLFDIAMPQLTQRESRIFSPGDAISTFSVGNVKIGLGICYDIRFEEMARIYRKQGCDIILYPGAFSTVTGPLHWELLLRSRASDAQVFTAGIGPAPNSTAKHPRYGHTMAVDPWGKVLCQAKQAEEIVVAEMNMNAVLDVRKEIPIEHNARYDLYETVHKI